MAQQNLSQMMNMLMALERLQQSGQEQSMNRAERERVAQEQIAQKNEAGALTRQAGGERLRDENMARAYKQYEWEQANARARIKALNDEADKQYQLQLKPLSMQRELALKGWDPGKYNSRRDALNHVISTLGGPGKGWTSQNYMDSLAPLVKEGSFPSAKADPTAWAFADELMDNRHPGGKTTKELLNTYLDRMAPHGDPDALQAKIAGLKRPDVDAKQLEQLNGVLSESPDAAVQRYMAAYGEQSPQSQAQESPLSQLGAMVRGDIEKRTGSPLPDVLAPFAAGTITGAGGKTYVVPTAGHGQDVVSQGFDAYNKDPRAALAPAAGTRVSPSSAPSIPQAPPVDARPIEQSPTLNDFMQGVTGGHQPNPDPSLKPEFGVQDLHHMVAAHQSWNGPRSQEIKAQVANMDPAAVHDVLQGHSIKTGIPLEHLLKAGRDSGVLGGEPSV